MGRIPGGRLPSFYAAREERLAPCPRRGVQRVEDGRQGRRQVHVRDDRGVELDPRDLRFGIADLEAAHDLAREGEHLRPLRAHATRVVGHDRQVHRH